MFIASYIAPKMRGAFASHRAAPVIATLALLALRTFLKRPLLLAPLALTILAALFAPGRAHAQEEARRSFDRATRSGFFFGAAAGVGALDLTGRGVAQGTHAVASLPNLRVGYMLSPRTAVVLVLPGEIYRYRGVDAADRSRYRGFEAIVPSVQHWVMNRWWVSGGAGLALDAPTFFDIKAAGERRFQVGAAAIVGTGYEIWRRGRIAWDVQGRAHYGRTATGTPDERRGLAGTLLLGVTAF